MNFSSLGSFELFFTRGIEEAGEEVDEEVDRVTESGSFSEEGEDWEDEDEDVNAGSSTAPDEDGVDGEEEEPVLTYRLVCASPSTSETVSAS
jgi:hypothetical protein